jgi:3',5'-cyclic AMP phosphodiesterase CpdA
MNNSGGQRLALRRILGDGGFWFFAVAVIGGVCTSALAQAPSAPRGILLAVGDITGCDRQSMQNSAKTTALINSEITKARRANIPVRVILAGDLAYEDGDKKDFSCFDKSWGKALQKASANYDEDVLPVPGNHEYRSENGRWFFEYFASNRWLNPSRTGYFSTTFPHADEGSWQLIGLNSELVDNGMRDQEAWLDGVLRSSCQRCVLAFWHRPVFSSGHHGHGDSGEYKTGLPAKQKEMSGVFDLLYGAGASVVINGHDHNFEELLPHNPEGGPDTNGLRTFVTGTGGKGHHSPYKVGWTELSQNYDAQSFGVLKLEIYPERYNWSFITEDSNQMPMPKYEGKGECNARKPAT